MIFEIGDTDSGLQSAAVHNARMDLNDADSDGIADIDPDEDGFADWGWSIDYTQPGTIDVDNADGDFDLNTGIDGDPNAANIAGLVYGLPPSGAAVFDVDIGVWGWVYPADTIGFSEDAYGLFLEDGSYDGPLSFGGFNCDEHIPWADFAITLYGPGNELVCPADLNSDGQLDFFDISVMLLQQPDYNGDTGFDFFDISSFLADYSAGCSLPGI